MEIKFYKHRTSAEIVTLLKTELQNRLEEEREHYSFKLKNGEDYKKLIMFLFDKQIPFELV
jgi:hypothetical protein